MPTKQLILQEISSELLSTHHFQLIISFDTNAVNSLFTCVDLSINLDKKGIRTSARENQRVGLEILELIGADR